ncbi:hypothetical protein CDV36_010645 [Fusarium kuroshium]|uniref:Heterokaryon incompatibility domain-containing protein n=1 Tax=Fusarium kuroshium TaxID=2010991 RepID=A0A3M2RWR6_9HYPO|nr:hypothetical protein CDV36_010645 [Fusarium kuroshium]
MASVQDILEGEQLLERLWREPGRADLRCLVCQEPFTDDALIRTFRVEPPGNHDAGYSTVVPTRKGDILFFDRHMSCVVEHQVKFSAVSHVWDPNISQVQQQRQTVPQTPVAARNVLDISAKIYSGIEEAKDTADEVWLDYLSVPQWSDTLKNNIIRIMHKLFTTAEKTILYFADVDSDVVKQLYKKERSPERLNAVISVCNSQYFKRVWTAMEFIRSGCVRMMTSDCTCLSDLGDPAFFNRLYHVWNEEVRHYAQVQHLEGRVKMGKQGKNGKNQVPWSLGTLREAKALKRVNFAMGSTLLCKRGCRDQMDYLHALRGIVPVSSATPMSSDFKTEFYQVAWECLKAGDLSPLLMTPFMEMGDPRGPGHWSEFAFTDVFTWSLAEEKHAPVLEGETRFNDIGQILSLNLQEIGVVSVVRQPRDLTKFDLLLSFSFAAMTALEFDGPDVKDFVAAMERTHGAMPTIVMKNLEARKEVQRLQKALTRNFNKPALSRWPIQGEDDVKWLADALSLSQVHPGGTQSTLAKNSSEYGTMHCAPYDYTVGITCMGCHRIFAHRVASFVLPTELRFAKAYRIPELEYRFSHKNGLALLVQRDRVVGRMIWATPACACTRTETVTLRMPKLFLPKSFYDK